MKIAALLLLCLTVPAQVFQRIGGSPYSEMPSGTLHQFVDAMGINTHFSLSTSVYYTNFSLAETTLQNLGIKHFRDSAQTDGTYATYIANLNTLVAAGMLGDYISFANDGSDITTLLGSISGMYSAECFNEPDNFYPMTWQSMLATQLPGLHAIGVSNSLPILGPSLIHSASYTTLGNISAYINFTNIHPYPNGYNPESTNPANSLLAFLSDAQISYPGGPIQATETGYFATPTSSPGWSPLNTNAVYMPRVYLHFWNQGLKRTYVYELMDDPGTTQNVGLTDNMGNVRPAYTAVQNLTSLFSDSATTFSPTPLVYSFGAENSFEHVLLQKTDGSYWLSIWQPLPIWDPSVSMSITVNPITVNVTWADHSNYEVYAFQTNGTVVDGGAQTGAQASVAVGAPITVVKIW